jgi:biotin transport system substrate-specific component
MRTETLEQGLDVEATDASRTSPLVRTVTVLVFAVLTAIAARVAVPLPGTAVPFTLQIVAVLLAGLILGPRLGALSQATYLAMGVVGLPVFAAGGGAAYLLGPTGGYLLAFPAGAALAGVLGRRNPFTVWAVAGGLLGVLAVHAGGLAWLTVTLGFDRAVEVGLAPFLLGDVLQIGMAVIVAAGLRRSPAGRLG